MLRRFCLRADSLQGRTNALFRVLQPETKMLNGGSYAGGGGSSSSLPAAYGSPKRKKDSILYLEAGQSVPCTVAGFQGFSMFLGLGWAARFIGVQGLLRTPRPVITAAADVSKVSAAHCVQSLTACGPRN